MFVDCSVAFASRFWGRSTRCCDICQRKGAFCFRREFFSFNWSRLQNRQRERSQMRWLERADYATAAKGALDAAGRGN
jgi:hypothetical protein